MPSVRLVCIQYSASHMVSQASIGEITEYKVRVTSKKWFQKKTKKKWGADRTDISNMKTQVSDFSAVQKIDHEHDRTMVNGISLHMSNVNLIPESHIHPRVLSGMIPKCRQRANPKHS